MAFHKFPDWSSTLDRIFYVPLSDGWFEGFIDEEPEEPNSIKLPKELDTSRARIYFKKAMEKDWLRLENDRYRWIGTNDKGNTSELAYFLGRVYNYKHTFNGNDGEDFPEESLNKLFYAKRLYSSLTQVYNAKKPQRLQQKFRHRSFCCFLFRCQQSKTEHGSEHEMKFACLYHREVQEGI